LRGYIAAGFDPARFWKITPRLFALEMEGASDRAEIRRQEIWFTAMLSSLKKPPSLAEFTGKKSRSDLAECLAQWDKVDAALARRRAA
jgi:hypothetical protein